MTDYLSRQPYLDLLKSIIANQCDNSSGYSFAIDGEWGSGKSWILQELEKKLLEEKDNKYLIFHYNAWENDFYDEPLVAILSVMIEKLEEVCKAEEVINGINKKLEATSLKILKNLAISIANTTLQNKIGVDFKDVVEDFQKISDENSDLKSLKKDVDSFLTLKCGIKKIRIQLSELAQGRHILLIIDELDRCLPEYAIKVLERLHHICNEMPVIQILAINKRNFADSISNVFGKNFYNSPYSVELTNQFAESYLQKFVDAIIPLPNGHPISQLEILNGLETKFNSYIRQDTIGRPFINLDENFLAECISSIMDGVERRLQEKIFKQVALCHELTIQSGIQIDRERITYAFLIYELLSCITKFVLHGNTLFFVREAATKESFILSLYQVDGMSKTVYETEHSVIISNIERFFNVPKTQNQTEQFIDSVFIRDTKSYLMAFFTDKPTFPYYTFESGVWDWIAEDKVFLKKYDEIMDMLVKK